MIIRAALLFSQAAVISGGLWLDVPFVRQDKNSCGSAVVWMVMQYWRKASTPPVAEIHRELYWEEAHGIYARDMERYLNRHAFQTFAFEAAWDDHRGAGGKRDHRRGRRWVCRSSGSCACGPSMSDSTPAKRGWRTAQ